MVRFWCVASLCAIGSLVPSLVSAQIVMGQVDTFQDGTLMGWGGGDQLSNVPNGGPSGVGDRFFQAVSFGGGGAGSRLATFNDFQWTGDYTAAGVNSVSVYMNNLGATDLNMRVVLFRLTDGGTQWTSTNPIFLPAGSGWLQKTFSLLEADLTQVEGTASYALVMSRVDRLMFRHQSGPPADGGTPIVATLGMDNITAVPEPATLVIFGIGIAALTRLRKSRSH